MIELHMKNGDKCYFNIDQVQYLRLSGKRESKAPREETAI